MLGPIRFSHFRGAVVITLFHTVLLEASRLFTTSTPSVFFTKRSNVLRYIRPVSMTDGTTMLFTDKQPVISGFIAAAILQLKREADAPAYVEADAPAYAANGVELDNRTEKLMAQRIEDDSDDKEDPIELNVLFDSSTLYSRRTAPMPLGDGSDSNGRRDKRLHNFALLRGYNGRRPQAGTFGDVADVNPSVRSRPKRLHGLSILRGYGTPLVENLPAALAAATRYASTKRHLKKRSLHQLSLLRSCSGKPPTLQRRTKKSLHQLSRLRSFHQKQPSLSRQLETADDRQPQRRLKKSLHGLALLRGFHRPLSSDVPSSPRRTKKSLHGLSRLRGFNRNLGAQPFYNKGIDSSQLRTKRSLHGLSLLRRFEHNAPSSMFFRGFAANSAERRRARNRRSLHNLSLLRGFDRSAVTLPLSAHSHQEDDGDASGRVRRRGKRVHNLSLLRYDGKLFQNMFAAPPQDFQQKRFEQKRFSRLLHQLQQKKSEQPTTIYLYE